MDTRILDYYNHELQYVRDRRGFRALPEGRGTPGVGGHGLCQPLRRRLLEGFAFLAARVHLKIDDQFPTFTQHLLEMVYPHYLAPTPSMAVVQFRPNLDEGSLAEGFVIRTPALRGLLGEGEQTACEYRTAHEVTLWPLEIAKVEYFNRDAAPGDLPALPQVKACLQIRLRCTAGLNFHDLALEELPLYVGSSKLAAPLYEQLLSNTVGIAARGTADAASRYELLDSPHLQRRRIQRPGSFTPVRPGLFQGYRLLHEYFAFRDRYFFVAVTGLKRASNVARATSRRLHSVRRTSPATRQRRRRRALAAVLLSGDQSVSQTQRPHPTRRPLDRTSRGPRPHAAAGFRGAFHHERHRAWHDVRSGPAVSCVLFTRVSGGQAIGVGVLYDPPPAACRFLEPTAPGARSSYVGSEVFLSLVDSREAPYSHDLRQLSTTTLCTNRDLPLFMPIGATGSDFTLEIGAPVESIQCVAGPTRPRPSFVHAGGELGWRLVSHLTLNYLSLSDTDSGGAAAALQELLRLYADLADDPTRQQIDGLLAVSSQPVVRQHPTSRRMSLAAGCKSRSRSTKRRFTAAACSCWERTRPVLRPIRLHQFLHETCIKTDQRGEIIRWPATIGRRHTI